MAKNKEQLLSTEQVSAVTEFAEALYSTDRFGVWTPFLSNSLMQGLNNSAKEATITKVRKALADYKNNAELLQDYMEFTNCFDQIFARALQTYINALSYDLQIVCTNAYSVSDYESDDYAQDKRRVYEFLNKFNYKKEFAQIVRQVMLHEVYYTSFRTTKWGTKGQPKYAIQILPQNYCILTGYWEKGLLFDFDMGYFLQAGTDLNLYDPSMTKAYNRVFIPDGKTAIAYNPANALNDRTGQFATWTQLSPNDGYWAFKLRMDNFNATPFLAPAMKSALTNDEIQQLQYSKDMAEAYAILAGEIGTFDTAKSGTQQDQTVFKPSSLANFMKLAKSGLSSIVKLAALPVENMDWYQFEDKNTDMLENQLVNSASEMIGAGRLIYANDRMSNAEVEAAQNEIYQTVKPMYYQFSNFLEFYINKHCCKKYHFKFIFDGSTYNWERSARLDRISKIADKGIVLPQSAWASALGYEPQIFEAMIAESKYNGWLDKYSQMMTNTNTAFNRNESNGAGRPMLDNDELSDSGEMNRDS